MATSPQKLTRLETSKQRHSQPRLHDDLLVDEIFTRLPFAAAIRFRAVCRAWNAALTSDHFIRARATARQPELLFFVPPAAANDTSLSLYTCTLRNGEAPPAARELLTVSNLNNAEHVVLSPKPCRGLTLIIDGPALQYYVCNLSTGEHVALPPCEPAAAVTERSMQPMRIGMGFHRRLLPWLPFQLESTGLGFDEASGEHKVVRLFKDPGNYGQTKCEVCSVPWGSGSSSAAASGYWRPCRGRVPPHAAGFVPAMPPVFVGGHLYWLLDVVGNHNNRKQPAILYFSMDAEQFELVQTPPVRRICHLTDFDGSLCAVVDVRHELSKYVFFTWSGSTASPWSLRCCIDLDGLTPREVSDEFVEERDVVPLCSAGGKVLLATGRHKVFAYDPGQRAMERVFYAQEFVDVPHRHREAPLRLSIVLHEESIDMPGLRVQAGSDRMLQVKLGGNTVAKRQVVDEHRDNRFRHYRDLFKMIDRLGPLPPHMTNSRPNYT